MIPRELRLAVLERTSISRQAVSQRIQRYRRQLGALSNDDGWCLVAAVEGLDISKFLDPQEVSRIRELYGRQRAPEPILAKGVPAENAAKEQRVNILPNVSLTDPLLSPSVVAEAKLMAQRVYPLVYILENSMRAFIIRIMTAAHGSAWWDTDVPASVKNPVADRMKKDERLTWHGKRNANPIYYTDTPHLIEIVEANWKDFKPFLPKKEFFTQRLWEINQSRRAIAHNNPLAADDRQRLEIYFKDWQRHVASIAPTLP